MALDARVAPWPAEHRRWILLNAVLATAIANVVFNAGPAWFATRGVEQVPFWTTPGIDRPSVLVDTVGTVIILPVATALLSTRAVVKEQRRGRLALLPALDTIPGWLCRLPVAPLRQGLVLGALCLAATAPALVVLSVADGDLSRSDFVVYKGALGLALGALVAPIVAARAMAPD